MTNTYPRETVEFQPVTVLIDGAPVTAGVTFAVVAYGDRPVTFTAPVTLGGQIGVMVSGLVPGMWVVWAQVADAPEMVIIDTGAFTVT